MDKIGVVGAGTMGSGIALAALLADFHVRLFDVSDEMLARARDYIEEHLNRKHRAINLKYLANTSNLEDLRDCAVVIEAIPEELPLKQALFAQLDTICPHPAVLASNTSTLSVTGIAAAVEKPERVAGMHFFNPAPVLPLVEIVRGARSSPETLETLIRLARRMGKTPVVAGDTPGFIVNRVARPFYGEALRLLGEGAATHSQIDQIVRESGGFRMGPFELMDLIGIDINYAAAQSVYEQTFYEPRYRPHRIQAQMVAQKAFGRKSGRGFYEYTNGKSRQENPVTKPVRPLPPVPVLLTRGPWGPGLAEMPGTQVIAIESLEHPDVQKPEAAIILEGPEEGQEELVRRLDQAFSADVPLLCQCACTTLAEISTWVTRPERLAGFDGLFFANGSVATLIPSPVLRAPIRGTIDELVTRLGRVPIWIEDVPGLVLPRIVSALANEAAFAAGEGVAEPATIDQAMQLGTNYPKGPLSWAKEIGYAQIVAVLDHLHREYGEERYRVAPLLRKWARLERI